MERAVAFRTIMNSQHRDHPNEDALERLLLNQSDEEELEIVETHILGCESCVTRLEGLELNLAAMKMALETFQAEQLQKQAQPAAPVSFWKSWLTIPKLSFAGAALAACALAVSWVEVPRQVTLMSYRGAETTQVAEFRPLQLHLNAHDLTAGPVRVELVTGGGNKLWEGPATIQKDTVNVRVPRLTASGTYYVRILAAQPASGEDELLREFSIKAKPAL
jgi:hypothetical protein